MTKIINKAWIYGKHAVLSVLQNQSREVYKVLATSQSSSIIDDAGFEPNGFRVSIVSNDEISKEIGNRDAVHQGIAAYVGPVETFTLTELVEDIKRKDKVRLVAFDQLTDPHNIGAIIRTCAAFDIDGVIVTKQHTNVNSPTVAKSSSGMIDLVKIYEVANLSNAIVTLKENGFWIIGLDSNTNSSFNEIGNFKKCMLVLGAEGDGLRRMTKEHCDILCKIPLSSKVDSLNVSNAAAIAIYEIQK